eukprot:gene7158-7965_t
MNLLFFFSNILLILTVLQDFTKVFCGKNPSQRSNGDCISSIVASANVGRRNKTITLEVKWSISNKEQTNLLGFYFSYIVGNGRSRSLELPNTSLSFELPALPLDLLVIEQYIFTIQCKHKDTNAKADPKSSIFHPQVSQLQALRVDRCSSREKISFFWKRPNVTGFASYVIRHSTVVCKNQASCCSNLLFKDAFQLSKDSNNFTYRNFSQDSQHCFEILMCPENGKDDLNCEIKISPFLVSCRNRKSHAIKKKPNLYYYIFGMTAFLTIICFIIIFICLRKHRKSVKKSTVSLKLLTQVKQQPADFINNETKSQSSNHKAPLLLIIFCSGCNELEEFVINLIHILRLNGIDAVSEITEEDQVQKFGRGVYLNDRLKEADFIMMLCTEEYSTESRTSRQNLYFYALNVIQNRVIKQAGNMSQYIMVHLGRLEFIPETLQPAGIDFGTTRLYEIMHNLLRRIFAVGSFHLDANAGPRRNEFLLDECTEKSSGFVRKRTSSRAKRVWNHGLRLKWKELREIHRRGPPGPTGPKKENLKAKKTEKNVKQSGPQTQSTKPTKFKKNEYFIDPKLYDKMRRVTSMKDFVEIFKPPGYSIKKELVKEPGRPGGLPGATGISGRKPDSLGPLGGGKGPIGPPGPDTFVAKDVIYFNSRKVADTLVEDPYKLGCALKSRNHLIPHKPGEFLLPRCINLKKCSGCCQLSMECVSTSTVNKTVPVFVIDGCNGQQESAGAYAVIVVFASHAQENGTRIHVAAIASLTPAPPARFATKRAAGVQMHQCQCFVLVQRAARHSN